MTAADDARLDAVIRRILREELHPSVLRFVPPSPANQNQPPSPPPEAA